MRPLKLLTSPAPPPLGVPAVATELEERRRRSTARFAFTPDPRRLRELLTDVEAKLADCDGRQRRMIRLLTVEIVSRLLSTSPRTPINLAVEQKENSIRLEVWHEGVEPCDFFDAIDEAVFVDLASVWGRDRRRECGAWFEVL